MHNLTKIRIFRALLWITYPFALLFLYVPAQLRRKSRGRLFFFFDRYVIGGAQRIHLDILDSIRDVPKEIYFTRVSVEDSLKEAFYSQPNSSARDIHFWCDNLLIRLFTVHYLAFYLNRHPGAQVFSSNSTFFYDLLPFLSRKLIKTELLHNFTGGKRGMEAFGLANAAYLDHRVIYDNYTLSNIKKQYAEYGIPDHYLARLRFIEPGVIVPAVLPAKPGLPLRVLYAGRGGAQKRIWLLDRVAADCIRMQLPLQFHFAGTMTDELSAEVKAASVLHGQVSGKEEMNALYAGCHVLLMTSAYEGFPMAIKEAMAYGCIPVVTALEGNKMHLAHERNALLIESIEDEEAVVAGGIRLLRQLCDDGALRAELSSAANKYAAAHFNRAAFLEAYRKFLTA